MQVSSYTFRDFIHLAVGVLFVMVHHRNIVRRLRHLRFEERDNGLRIVVVHIGLIETIEQQSLFVREQRYRCQRCVRLLCESRYRHCYGFCQTLHHCLRITAIVIFNHHRRCAIDFHDIERYLEFRHVEFHALRPQRYSLYLIVTQHTNLVCEHDFCRQVVVCRNLGKWIVLVAKCLFKPVARLFQKLAHMLLSYFGTQCECIDQHTDGLRHLQFTPSVRDSGDTNLLCVSIARQGIEHSRQSDRGSAYPCFMCQVFRSRQIHRRMDLSYLPILRVGQIRRYLRHSLHVAQARMEEGFRFLISKCLFRRFLFLHELRVRRQLRLYRLTIKQSTKFLEEYIIRSAVTYKVMHITVEIQGCFRLHNTKTTEPVLAKIERAHELGPIGFKFRFFLLHSLHVQFRHLHFLNNFRVIGMEMHEQFRMIRRYLTQRIFQLLLCHTLRHTRPYRDIIDSGCGIFHTIEVNTSLGVG